MSGIKLSDYDFTNLSTYPNMGFNSKKELVELAYMGNSLLRDYKTKIIITQEAQEEYDKCKNDLIYFIETYVKIITIDYGLIKAILRDYQKEQMNIYQQHQYLLILQARQSGKTQITSAYLTWKLIFNDNLPVGVVGNKATTSDEIVDRIKSTIEFLPPFLQPSIKKWNTKSIELGNGSKIYSSVAGPSALRGKTCSIVYCVKGDTKITVKDKLTNEIKKISIEELYNDV